MAELERWTPADDDFIRSALATLRRDVEEVTLAEPAFIRARGDARRRRRMLAWTAAGAAAALVIAGVAMSSLGRIDASPAPATKTTHSSPTTSSTSTGGLSAADALPLASEWIERFGMPAGTVRTNVQLENTKFICGVLPPGQLVIAQTVGQDPSVLNGSQELLRVPAGAAHVKAADLVRDLLACRQPYTMTEHAGSSAWPRVLSYRTGHTGSGWVAIMAARDNVSLLHVIDPAATAPPLSLEKVRGLAGVAQQRLEQYDGLSSLVTSGPVATTSGGSLSTTGKTLSPATGSTGGAATASEPIVGVGSVPPSSMFVPAADWSSQALTGGARTTGGRVNFEGGAQVALCDADSPLGDFGILGIKNTANGYFFGRQRVRDTGSSAKADSNIATLDRGFTSGCTTFGNGHYEVTKGSSPHTYRVKTVFNDGSSPIYEFIGITKPKESRMVSTLVITSSDMTPINDLSKGFSELDRLLSLASQR